MLLVVDIGNTSTVFGVYDSDKLVKSFRTVTGEYTDDEIKKAGSDIDAVAVSSVVPAVNEKIMTAVIRNFGCKVEFIDSHSKCGFSICTDYPEKVGADILCGAAAAFDRFRKAVIVFDLGTATTVCAVDNQGNYLGHSIYPGVRTSFRALHSAAALLPDITDDFFCTEVIGKNTVSSMKSGVLIGAACFIDGMAKRYKEQLNCEAEVIVTGGLAPVILPMCYGKYHYDEYLLLDGIRIIYNLSNK